MRQTCLLIFLLLVNASDAKDHFAAGLAASRTGQFSQAADEFRASLIEQPASGTLINLGIAEWRRHRIGEAMWSWQQAEWLNPYDPAARNNLNFAHDSAQTEPLDLPWHEAASTWLAADHWAWILGGSLSLAFGLIIFPRVFRAHKAGWHQAGAAVGLGIFILSVPANVGVLTRGNVGVVLQKNAVLRLTPTKEGETVTLLGAGEYVRKMREHGDYVFIRTARARGWMEKPQVALMNRMLP